VAFFPYAITAFLILSIIFQGYRRYRLTKAGLLPVPTSAFTQGHWQWWSQGVIVLMLLFFGYLAWHVLFVDHRGFMSALPPILAGVIMLWAIFSWFTARARR
jgi:hypothetical protein